jgi:hypothetical protein
MVERIGGLLLRASDSEGKIPLNRQRELREAISSVILSTILNVSQGQWQAWRILPDGSIEPESPFFQLMWATMTDSMKLAVKEQSDLMEARMADWLISRLRVAHLNPFAIMDQLPKPEQAALRRYQHPLAARRSDGRQLSERLQIAAAETVRKTMQPIDSWIAGGFNVRQMQDMLERYYSGKLSLFGSERGGIDLRRIARSEPIFAFSQAAIAAAATNPYVGIVHIERTRSEPCPICDPIAANSPYPIEDAPLPGFHAHCLCKFRFETLRVPEWDTDHSTWRQSIGAVNRQFIDLLERMQRSRGE